MVQNTNTWSDDIMFSTLPTAAGICIMATLKNEIQYTAVSTEVIVSLRFKDHVHGLMAVFPVEKFPLIRYMNPNDSFIARGGTAAQASVSLQIMEIVYRDNHKIPCVDAEAVSLCLVNCIEKEIYEKHGVTCRLTFMQESKTHQCRTREEYADVKNVILYVLQNFNQTNCNCPKACRAMVYSVTDIYDVKSGYTQVIFRLKVNEHIPTIQEEAAYTFVKLLSDLGGSLGLYFGLGLLQIIEMLVDIIAQLDKQLREKLL